MSAGVSSSYSGAPATGHSGMGRVGLAVFGVAAVVVGGILLFNPYTAAKTLALFIGLALLIGGLMEVAAAWDSDRKAPGLVLGAVLIIGGLVTLFWPGPTLWTIAVITGLSLLIHGIGRVVLAFAARAQLPSWGWFAFAGVLNIIIGILALAWPEATILVLSLMLGFQILIFGVFLLVAAFASGRAPAHA
jgi:uncharacterized membrane protein HdeD (DUF308 family)